MARGSPRRNANAAGTPGTETECETESRAKVARQDKYPENRTTHVDKTGWPAASRMLARSPYGSDTSRQKECPVRQNQSSPTAMGIAVLRAAEVYNFSRAIVVGESEVAHGSHIRN